MPVQIKMDINLSTRYFNRSTPSSVVPSALGSSSVGRFKSSMIDRVHLSKQGCSSCGH